MHVGIMWYNVYPKITLAYVQYNYVCLWQLNHIKDHKPKRNHCKWFRADGNSSIISDKIGMSCY